MRKRYAAPVALLAAAGLFLSGCQQSNESSGVDNEKAQKESSKLPATAFKRADADQVKQGGHLNLALGQLPSNFNINQTDGALVDLDNMLDPVNGGPIDIKEDGTWTVDHDYAKSVKLVSEDPQVIEVKLNPDAVWENGDPITWKDYYWFWKALNGKNDAYQVASDRGFKDIGKVEKGKNKFDVKITYKKKNADWPAYLNVDLPKSVTKHPDKFNKGFEHKVPPSNGPFKVTNFDKSAQVITEKPNPKWWGDKPKLKSITWKVIDQNSQAHAYANKEIDAVETDVEVDSYKTAKKRDDGVMQKSNGVTWTHLTINGEHGALADKKVRRAMGHAIHREVIAKAAMGPVDAPVQTQNNTIFMPGQKGYQDDTNGILDYSPKKAKKILKKAGYTKQGNVRAKDGEKLAFKIVVPADTPTNEQRAKQVQKDLNAVGFKIKMHTVPVDKYFSDYVLRHKYDMATFSWEGTAFPIDSTVNLFYPKDADQNYTGISDPSIGKLAKKANSEFDENKRRKIADKMDKKILNVEGVIPFYPTPKIFGVEKGLVNYGAAQLEDYDWTKVGWKK